MKIESGFTMEDVRAFFDVYIDRERNMLAERLEQVSKRLAELGPRIVDERGDGEEWTPKEVLAHIAVVSKFYGVLVHRIASGKITELGLLDNVNLRDVAANQISELPVQELVRMARADQERTIEMLRKTEPSSLRRSVRVDDGTQMSAEEVARYPLVSHLETHLDQLEKELDKR